MAPLVVESWIWYGVVALVVAFRFTSRIIHQGSIKKLQLEDWLMLFVFCDYTVMVTTTNITIFYDTNLIAPADVPFLTPDSISSRIYGSKMILVVEQTTIAVQWGCKFCLLLLYHRLTFGLNQQIAVKVIMAYCLITLIVMEMLYFGYWCRPIYNYWAVPTPNIQCSTAFNHLIMNACFNISSDLMILCIPLPLLLASRLPRTKKAFLCILFGLGIFVILCAVLNKYYSFTQPFAPSWSWWYVREVSTAILVANIPQCWSLLRRIFKLHAFTNPATFESPDNTAAGPAHGDIDTATGRVRRTDRLRLGSHDADDDLWTFPPTGDDKALDAREPLRGSALSAAPTLVNNNVSHRVPLANITKIDSLSQSTDPKRRATHLSSSSTMSASPALDCGNATQGHDDVRVSSLVNTPSDTVDHASSMKANSKFLSRNPIQRAATAPTPAATMLTRLSPSSSR